jgi:NADH-quinone oxidoreductase subunit L
MSMTFFGGYRGPAWEGSGHGHAPKAAHDAHAAAHGDDAHGHGHGAWHGPHESPAPMTYPLMILAVGAIVAGFVGVPLALGGTNAIEHFLEPSFVAHVEGAGLAQAGGAPDGAAALGSPGAEPATAAVGAQPEAAPQAGEAGEGGLSHAGELGLMALSVLIGLLGIWMAYRFYVRHPEISERMAERWAGIHRLLLNKYYVDELYNATFIRGTMKSAFGLWTVDRRVVDGAVNGSGWLTVFSSWISHLIDRYVVDGSVNLIGRSAQESSFVFRKVQTGLIQNYALLMLFGVFAFVSMYLLAR